MSIGTWIYPWAFYSVPLICISVFVPVPYCLDDCGFVVEPEVRRVASERSPILLSQGCFGYSRFFVFTGIFVNGKTLWQSSVSRHKEFTFSVDRCHFQRATSTVTPALPWVCFQGWLIRSDSGCEVEREGGALLNPDWLKSGCSLTGKCPSASHIPNSSFWGVSSRREIKLCLIYLLHSVKKLLKLF